METSHRSGFLGDHKLAQHPEHQDSEPVRRREAPEAPLYRGKREFLTMGPMMLAVKRGAGIFNRQDQLGVP